MKKRIATTYTLVRNGEAYRIREETAGIKTWHTPTAWLDQIMGRNTFKPWETRHRWLANYRLSILRTREADLIREERAVWESVRPETTP